VVDDDEDENGEGHDGLVEKINFGGKIKVLIFFPVMPAR
jgi:hypothetical protein